jgi:hypothetical protein
MESFPTGPANPHGNVYLTRRNRATASIAARLGFSFLRRVERRKMTRTELIIQLLKVAIGLAFAAYFVWWSLQVLDRLTPEYDAPTAVVARAS